MSYINDALRKVQKEKESNYAAYGNIITSSNRNVPWPAKLRFLVGALIVFILIMGGVALFNLLMTSKEQIAKQATVAAVTSPSVRAVNAASGIVPEIVPAKPMEKPAAKVMLHAPALVPEEKVVVDAKDIFNQAMNKQREGKLDEAKELYRKVIKSTPRNIQALNNLGVIYMTQKNYKWAIIRFQNALAVKPDYVDAHYNLACLYSQKKDVARSLYYLKAAVKLNPEVRQWAKTDNDLKELGRFPDFNNLIDGKEN